MSEKPSAAVQEEVLVICPHCLKSIEDGSAVCPDCGSFLGSRESGSHSEFVFCDGCGARLSSRDRVCPKCGRPAPGILSTQTAASDLAAGKTASFPRFSGSDIETEARPVASDHGAGIEERTVSQSQSQTPTSPVAATGSDRYRRRRIPRRAIVAGVLIALTGFGALYVVRDPFRTMPGFYAGIRAAASDMFPSRHGGPSADGAGSDSSRDASKKKKTEQPSPASLTDEQAYGQLSAIYRTIGGFQSTLGDVIDAYNGSFLSKDHGRREAAAQPAYGLRQAVQTTLDQINALKLADGSAYAEDVEHMRSLATWMYARVDVLCRSWDISLTYTGDDRPTQHKTEISQPLRDAMDASGRNDNLVQFERNFSKWKPVQRSS